VAASVVVWLAGCAVLLQDKRSSSSSSSNRSIGTPHHHSSRLAITRSAHIGGTALYNEA